MTVRHVEAIAAANQSPHPGNADVPPLIMTGPFGGGLVHFELALFDDVAAETEDRLPALAVET